MSILKFWIAGLITTVAAIGVSVPSWALPLSPGDRLRLFVAGEEEIPEAERFSATYEVNLDGYIKFPYLDPILAAGREVSEIEQDLVKALLEGGFFHADFLKVSIQLFEWAPIQVTVGGAVFEPGRVLINDTDSKGRDLPASIATVSGDYPPERYLTFAILTAGGIKPNANIEQVRLVRGEQEQVIDLSGVFSGSPVEDIPLIAGDQIIVPTRELPQYYLARPSQLTPSTIPVFLSNLTNPNNGRELRIQEVEYGSRLSQAVIAASCVGGTESTNADRRALLLQTDRTTGETLAIERSVEDLVKKPNDEQVNPVLMPRDSVACYDSTVTNVKSVFDFIGDIFNPIRIIKDIFIP
ncbi:MAG: polysaccharide export protein [Moorea sp. SIO4G2]|nr:polysaccharide export protein [Moorena sp. SIO4G2]